MLLWEGCRLPVRNHITQATSSHANGRGEHSQHHQGMATEILLIMTMCLSSMGCKTHENSQAPLPTLTGNILSVVSLGGWKHIIIQGQMLRARVSVFSHKSLSLLTAQQCLFQSINRDSEKPLALRELVWCWMFVRLSNGLGRIRQPGRLRS